MQISWNIVNGPKSNN